jgi:hypothetical protein
MSALDRYHLSRRNIVVLVLNHVDGIIRTLATDAREAHHEHCVDGERMEGKREKTLTVSTATLYLETNSFHHIAVSLSSLSRAVLRSTTDRISRSGWMGGELCGYLSRRTRV